MATDPEVQAFLREQALQREATSRGLPLASTPADSQAIADTEVSAPTDPEVEAFKIDAAALRNQRPEVEPQFNIMDPSLRDLAADAGTFVGNIGPDARETGEALANIATPSGVAGLVAGVPQIAEGALELSGAGSGNLFIDLFGGGAPDDDRLSSRAKAARDFMKESTRLIREPQKTLINHPVQSAMDLAGIMSAGALGVSKAPLASQRITTAAGKLATLMELADPVNLVFKLGGKVINGAAFRALLGRTSGTGSEALKLATQAGREGGSKAEDLVKAMVGETTLQGVAQKVQDGFKLLRSERSRGFAESLENATLKPGQTLDIHGLQGKVFADLKKRHGVDVKLGELTEGPDGIAQDFKISIDNTPAGVRLRSPNAGRELAQVEGIVHQMLEAAKGAPNDWRRLHEVRKSISDLETFGGDPLGRTFLDDTVSGVRTDIGKELDKVQNFTATSREYAEATRDLEKISKALSIKDGIITETNLTKLANLLNTRTSGNLAIRRDAVHLLNEALSEATGQPSNIMEELAGLRLASDETLGIARTGGLQNAVAGGASLLGAGIGSQVGDVGAMMGFAAGGGLATMLAQSTIGSPRAVGQLFFNMGMAQKPAARMIKFLQDLKDKVPKDKIRQGLTVGAAWELVRQRPEARQKAQAFARQFGLSQSTPGATPPQR